MSWVAALAGLRFDGLGFVEGLIDSRVERKVEILMVV